MDGCEQFELALEKRLCRALPPDEEGALEAHLAGCPSCRAYAARARSTAAALRAPEDAIDWEALRRRVVSRRYASLAGAALYAAALVWLASTWWVERLARSSSALPSLLNLPLDVLVCAVLGVALLAREWSRAKGARDAASADFLRRLYHADLVGRIRWARASWMWLLFLPWSLLSPGRSVSLILIDVVLLALTLYVRFVSLPRLEREEQEYPFFDDFPHVV